MLTPFSALPPNSLLSPPDAVPSAPPVSTRLQVLPFDALSWENFERLCHRLTALDGDIDHCARYGCQGEAQEGIDIFARQTDGRYHCLQAKRHRDFGPGKLREAVDLFLAGSWVSRAIRFTIAVQASLRSVKHQEEIETLTSLLAKRGIGFAVLDGELLTECLRKHPVLIDDFFGRPWVVALLGQEVARDLGARLDGADYARARFELAEVYRAQFHFFDPGSFSSINEQDSRPELSLLERFLKPDILVRESSRTMKGEGVVEGGNEPITLGEVDHSNFLSRSVRENDASSAGRMRRIPTTEWLGDGQRFALLGEAGSGKSTLLRVIALDLLHHQEHFPELAARWGQHIPIYVPFARWSTQVARDNNAIGLKEIVRRSLDHLISGALADLLDRAINEQRVVLLIDGLDEWSSEQAARTTLGVLVTTVEAHGVPIIVSGRPLGLNRIGSIPATWKRGTVAPLSAAQQRMIASRWFGRYASATTETTTISEAGLRTEHFMAELARESNLGALAAAPLLLIGLVTLAIRGQMLPRTKNEIYDQLVRILLEVHPTNRATASGDTVPRFRHATDATQRRAAIARLAFSVREEMGGAGMPITAARTILRTYLASSEGFDLALADANAFADEVLSVNAETQGLIVEKSPSEVGFVHASFEEYLGAEHVCSWSFSNIEIFVNAHAGEGRWRNVIANVLGRIQRRDEFDRLIAIIDTPDSEEIAHYQRQFLLGDIAFSAGVRWTASVKRLAHATLSQVEREDWLPARREALASVLKGLADPVLKTDVGQRLAGWLPARLSYGRASLVVALGTWKPTVELQELLFQAMYDEDLSVQRAAAAAYANAFSPSIDGCQRLLDGLARTRNLTAAAALLESLALGWPNFPTAQELFNEAANSHEAELCLVGIFGLAVTGKVTDEARDTVLYGQSFWSGLSYSHRELATALLLKFWPKDESLIESALMRLSDYSSSNWEHQSAMAYLLNSDADDVDVRAWILAELKGEFPFNSLGYDSGWHQVGRFAAVNPEIRAAANAYWCEPKNRIINLNKLRGYVAWVADPQIASILINVLSDGKKNFDRYWALRALLSGWGRNHPAVKATIDLLVDAADELLDDLASLIPEIVTDKSVARDRLVRMSKRTELRRDLLAIGLEACGCDGSDNEAVEAILLFPEQLRGNFAPTLTLFRVFGTHPRVRKLAMECIRDGDESLAAIASAYPDDPEFALVIRQAAVPLPIELRAQIVEVAATGASGTSLEIVLSQYMIEADPELRVRMVIAYCRSLLPEAREAARQTLLAQAVAFGGDLEPVRAAALAGLVTMDEIGTLAILQDRGKPAGLSTGVLVHGIATVERLICERFAEFQAAFGDSLPERLKTFGRGDEISRILSRAPGASPAARTAFLDLAERGGIPLSSNALRALAGERPSSDLLLARCWDVLGNPDRSNESANINADVGLILREHFPGSASVKKRLIEQFKRSFSSPAIALPLAIFAPDAEVLPYPHEADELGRRLGNWAVAVQVAAHRADTTDFCKLLEFVVARQQRTKFDAQHIINLAVEERILRDSELVKLLSARIQRDVDPSISGSFARYLAAAGKLSSDARSSALDILQALRTNQRLPVAGYDAIADEWRAVRATILDAVSAGFELA